MQQHVLGILRESVNAYKTAFGFVVLAGVGLGATVAAITSNPLWLIAGFIAPLAMLPIKLHRLRAAIDLQVIGAESRTLSAVKVSGERVASGLDHLDTALLDHRVHVERRSADQSEQALREVRFVMTSLQRSIRSENDVQQQRLEDLVEKLEHRVEALAEEFERVSKAAEL